MKVLITGAKGMLGREISLKFKQKGYIVTETDRSNLDIEDFENVKTILFQEKPDAVIHCAACTNVEQAETEPEKAFRVNKNGTENIAKVCSELNCILIYISTDYVFDGEKNAPYLPEDKPNPLNVYGLSKFYGEKAVKQYCEKFYIVRTSWLFGKYGKNFPDTMLALKDKPEIKVVNDQTGCPTSTVYVAEELAKFFTKPYGIYHICGGGSTTWYEFAQEVFRLSGIHANIKPCTTAEYPSKVKRPLYSVLQNSVPEKSWQSLTAEFIRSKEKENLI